MEFSWNKGRPHIRSVPSSVCGVVFADRQVTNISALWRKRDSATSFVVSGVPRGGFKPPPRNSEGPPKSCQTQPDCENC